MTAANAPAPPGGVGVHNIYIHISKGPTVGIAIAGAIYQQGADDNAPPVVSDVNARVGLGSRCALGVGKYVYRFHVESGAGKFTADVDDGDTGKSLGSNDYDTTRGAYALTLRFEVA